MFTDNNYVVGDQKVCVSVINFFNINYAKYFEQLQQQDKSNLN